MPSTIGYANLSSIMDRQRTQYQLLQDITQMLLKQDNNQVNSVEMARKLYDASGALMNKHQVDLLTYYESVAKVLKNTNASHFNNSEIATTLIKLIESSSNPLHELIKKGVYSK